MNTTKNSQTKWKPTDNRFVAFIDILGFKDKIMRKSHEEIYDELSSISRIKNFLERKISPLIKNNFIDCDVYIVSFSDSIVVFSKNDTFKNFEYFLICIRAIFANSIKNGIALKGGFAHGLISINKNEQIYFGQPIIDAYLIEEDVNYLGVVAHNSINKYIEINKKEFDASTISNQLLFEEKSFLKCGKILHTNLDWFMLTVPDRKEKTNSQIFEEINNIIDKFYNTVSGSPRRYIDNTKELLEIINMNKKINYAQLKL